MSEPINEMPLRTCRDCFWWKPVPGMQRDGLPIGECRVKSPQTFQRNDERATVVTRWPLTVSLDFCGMQRPGRREQGAGSAAAGSTEQGATESFRGRFQAAPATGGGQ